MRALRRFLRGNREAQTDLVELRAEGFTQELEIVRSEITVLEF